MQTIPDGVSQWFSLKHQLVLTLLCRFLYQQLSFIHSQTNIVDGCESTVLMYKTQRLTFTFNN